MSNTTISYLVAGCAGVLSLAAYASFVLRPAWTAYSRAWERLAAAFLSLYVLGALVGAGLVVGGAIVYLWDRVA